MRHIFALVIFSIPCLAQTFDTYGGWNQSACSGGVTGKWYTEKVTSHWWLCTPLGHHLFYQGVGGSGQPTNAVAKYGSVANWANGQISFLGSKGFNGIGELSDSNLYATNGALSTKTPFIETINVSTYATVNLNSVSSRPIKNYIWALGSSGSKTRSRVRPSHAFRATTVRHGPTYVEFGWIESWQLDRQRNGRRFRITGL